MELHALALLMVTMFWLRWTGRQLLVVLFLVVKIAASKFLLLQAYCKYFYYSKIAATLSESLSARIESIAHFKHNSPSVCKRCNSFCKASTCDCLCCFHIPVLRTGFSDYTMTKKAPTLCKKCTMYSHSAGRSFRGFPDLPETRQRVTRSNGNTNFSSGDTPVTSLTLMKERPLKIYSTTNCQGKYETYVKLTVGGMTLENVI
uniref:Uncharacterized protein n=1 Tax=Glossina pallidipes TaxID=7398 RepID=A0A1A9ZGB9_GLOPL